MFSIRLATAVAFALLILSFPAIAAEKQVPHCEKHGENWEHLDADGIEKYGVTRQAAVFAATLKTMEVRDPARHTDMVVTDCRVYGYELRAIRMPAMPTFGSIRDTPESSSNYTVYVTVGFLNFLLPADVARAARQQACIIEDGDVDIPQRPAEDPENPAIARCIVRAAIEAKDDPNFINWFARTNGIPVPEGSGSGTSSAKKE